VTALADPRPEPTRSDVRTLRGARATGRGRAATVSLVLMVVGFVLFCLSISIGDFRVPLTDVVPAIFGAGDPAAQFIVGELRLPRALAAVLVGAAFGLSGAIFQTLARNPLASPDFIGITSGASLAAVFGIVVLHAGGNVIVVAAFLGALSSAALIYALAWKRGLSSYRLVLVGLGVAAAVDAGTAYLLTKARIYDVQSAVVWLTGSLNGRTWEDIRPLALGMLVLVPATVALGPALRLLMLGDDTAAGLGLRVERSRLLLVLVAVTLTALATAAAGPVEFVALLAAPIARRLVGSPLALVPAALVGAVLVLGADVLAREALPTTALPVGVVTGIIGAPYLLWLLARSNRVGSGG
jgi:iron complex transport system permease protein